VKLVSVKVVNVPMLRLVALTTQARATRATRAAWTLRAILVARDFAVPFGDPADFPH
jgi:hypothetical protein